MPDLHESDIRLSVYAGNDHKFLKLSMSVNDIENLRDSRDRLIKVIELLDIYEQLIDAQIDSKAVMFKYALVRGVSIKRDVSFRTIRNEVNRNVFNTLNFGKLLLDKISYQPPSKEGQPQKPRRTFIKELWHDTVKHQQILIKRQEIYDTNINYVLGQYLRNYAQHNSVVSNTIHIGVHHERDTSNMVKYFSTTIRTELLKRLNREAQERAPEVIELPITMDGYVDGISELYCYMIELMRELVFNDIQRVMDFAELAVAKAELEMKDGSFVIEISSSSYNFYVNSTLCETISTTISKTNYPTQFQKTTFTNSKNKKQD